MAGQPLNREGGCSELAMYHCRRIACAHAIKTIAKWELSLETSFKTIRKTLAESVCPAIERIILLLEELRGWSSVYVSANSIAADVSSDFSDLRLGSIEIRHTLDVALGFAKLSERMRQLAEHELYAGTEWFKWLKYGQLLHLRFA